MRVPLSGQARRAAVPIMSLVLLTSTVVSPFGPAAAFAASSSAPAAPTSTMVLSFKQFPSGDPVPNALAATIPVAEGGSVTLTAPAQVFGSSSSGPSFGFAFWNAGAAIAATPTTTFTAPGGTFDATAWYFPEGGPGGPGGQPAVSTFAFSTNQDKVLAGTTPIASVTPSGAWAGPPATAVSTTTSPSPVAITASPLIAGSGLFKTWLTFGAGSATGKVLTVPANGSSIAIAFYALPSPDPCLPFVNELNTTSPSDFPKSFGTYENFVHSVEAQLQACRLANGE